MTVCVAAMGGGRVIGASDRMFTSGDIEFEPEQTKIVQITNSIGAMFAGDISLQVELLELVTRETESRIEAESSRWWTVREVADLYFSHYENSRASRASRALLHPLGLTLDSFRASQHQLSSDLVMRIALDIVNFGMPSIEAIFLGVDDFGAELYLVDNNGVTCQNGIGFAAIGIGAQHANSQLMFSAHHKFKSMTDALFAVYSSKRRAEIAPGVGSATDMCLVGPGKGTFISIGQHVLSEMSDCYADIQEQAIQSAKAVNERMAKFVEGLSQNTNSQEQSAPTEPHNYDDEAASSQTVPDKRRLDAPETGAAD